MYASFQSKRLSISKSARLASFRDANIDTANLKQIATSNVAILESATELTKLVEKIDDQALSREVRDAIVKLLNSAEMIQKSVGNTLKTG